MSKVVKPNIAAIGLKKYLDDTSLRHNQQGYAEFDLYVRYKVPLTAVGRLFHVGRSTAVKWYGIYRKEISK